MEFMRIKLTVSITFLILVVSTLVTTAQSENPTVKITSEEYEQFIEKYELKLALAQKTKDLAESRFNAAQLAAQIAKSDYEKAEQDKKTVEFQLTENGYNKLKELKKIPKNLFNNYTFVKTSDGYEFIYAKNGSQ